MCGRLFCLVETRSEFIEEIENELSAKIDNSEFVYNGPNFNIPPTSSIPVLDSSFKLKNVKWGFKVGTIFIINARNEGIESKRSFKDLLDSERCVLVCSGYYEWDSLNVQNKKLAYSFSPAQSKSKIFFIAALREPKSNSIVLMTRQAASSIENIHSRMPVLLKKENVAKWLDHDKFTFKQLRNILIDQEDYDCYIKTTALAPHVNNVKFNGPECLQSLEDYKEKSFSQGIGKYFPKIIEKKAKLSE